YRAKNASEARFSTQRSRHLFCPPRRVVAFSPDGKTLVSLGGHYDDSVRVWAVEMGTEQRLIRGMRGVVRALRYRPMKKRSQSGDAMALEGCGTLPRATSSSDAGAGTSADTREVFQP